MTGVLIPTASEAEWLEARRHGVTASEIPIIMGLSPWSSPYALYWRKLGELPEQEDNDAMTLGRYLEDYVCGAFGRRFPHLVVCGYGRDLFAHPDRTWQIATPDRWITEGEYTDEIYPAVAVLEAKTDASYDGWGEDGTDEIPVRYRCQVLWQCDVLGVDHWYLACLFLHSRKLRVYEGHIDGDAQADLKIMRDTAQCFLDDIRNGNPPDVDWRPATTTALKKLHPSLEDRATVIPKRMALAYRAACSRHKTAEAAKRRLENQIRERLGSASAAVLRDGTKVATRQVYGVKEHTRKACTVDKLVPAKIKDQP